MENKVVIDLGNNLSLIAEQNTDPEYNNKIYIGISKDNFWHQNLAIVRKADTNRFEILVYADEDNEDYTNKYTIGLHKDPEDK